tara:strand:- start:664 stop:891 length:228 start_codon:yes stop_codon:yes gene_type:complete
VDKDFNIISNPSHYSKGKIEPKDYIMDHDMNWAIGNAVKYLTRFPYKHKGEGQIDDLRKAREMIQIQIDRMLADD